MVGTRPSGGSGEQGGAMLGEQLRRVRQLKRLSLDHVSGELNIPTKHLQALEQGDLSVFSADVYARGAYEKYSGYLEIDTRRSHYIFLRSLSDARERVPLRLLLPATWFQRILTPSAIILAMVGLAVFGVASYLTWQVRTFVAVPDLVLEEPSGAIIEAKSVRVRGRADKNSQVSVNGEVVLLQDEDVFETDMPVRPGINVIRVEARGVSGRSNVIMRDVLVPRS